MPLLGHGSALIGLRLGYCAGCLFIVGLLHPLEDDRRPAAPRPASGDLDLGRALSTFVISRALTLRPMMSQSSDRVISP